MTKAKLTGLLALLAFLVGAALPVRAAEAQPRPLVVLVGVSEYADPLIKPRPNAEADAKALYDVFTGKDHLAVDPQRVRLLLGKPDETRKSQPATRENVVKALHWVATTAGPDDLVVFAYVGQGAAIKDRVCYFASDSTFKDRAKNAVAATDIETELKNLKSQNFCAFLDVNFKGVHKGAEEVPEPNRQNLYKEFLGADEENPLQGRVVFLATNGWTPSLQLPDHGLFTKAVVDGLKGAADKEGYEADGLVTVDELIEYLRHEVPELARKHGKTDEEKVQTHFVLGGMNSLVLSKNPAAVKPAQERVAQLARLAAEEKVSREWAEEGQQLLTRMPKLKALQNLRKAYQQLVDGKLSADDFTKERAKIQDGMKLARKDASAYAAKVIQATQFVREGYVKPLNQGEMVANGIKGLYARIHEKVPTEVADKLKGAKDLKEPELTRLLADVRERLGKREDLDNHKDLDFTLQRMLSHLDPYTTYIDPEMLKKFRQDTDGRFNGIGIQITLDSVRDMLKVITPIKGSPAYKAGLKAGDLITTIIREEDSEGVKLEKPEVTTTKGMQINDAVKKIMGLPKTKVKLLVEREGADKPLEFEITRGVVEVETVLGHRRTEDDNWNYYVDPEHKIAYVRLTSFARRTASDLRALLKRLSGQGLNGLVLDLRFNPGGLLTSAVEISDLFIDDGLIVTIKPRVGRQAGYAKQSELSYLNFPMVCLVNGGSASGSEIVAACLQDHKRAIVMGERSYGKGSVQNIQPFEGGELKMTTATFWRPSGRNLNKATTGGKEEEDWGVSPNPDYVLKLPGGERDQLFDHQRQQEIIPRRDLPPKKEAKEFKDRQLDLAVTYLRDQIKTAAKVPAKKAG